MKPQEFRKPLVQSALVLLGIFLLIGFVAGSETHTVFGGISAIFKGIFYTILLVIALVISLAVTIAFLIAIFLGAVAIYSPQSSSEMYHRLRQSLSKMWSTVSAYRNPGSVTSQEKTAEKKPEEGFSEKVASAPLANSKHTATQVTSQRAEDPEKELSAEIQAVERRIKELQQKNTDISTAVNELENKITEIPVEEVSATAEMLAAKQDELSANLNECLSRLDTIDDTVTKNQSAVQQQDSQLKAATEKIAELSAEIESLKEKMQQTEEPEESAAEDTEEPRIFAYLESDSDKKKFADLVDQAVEENMTYAEIDEFLTEKLSEKVDTIIKEHPSLTKEYIRDRKNA